MIIKNKNGEFAVSSTQYNFLTHHFVFNDINSQLVLETSFINSTWDWDKAREKVVDSGKYKDILK